MTSALYLEELAITEFRNIESLTLVPAARVNVIAGDNGQGKTSVLEALYCVATSRSFRADKTTEMVRQGARLATVRMTVSEAGHRRRQRVVLGSRVKNLFLDDKKPESVTQFALRTPVVVFQPGDLALTTGSASLRRRLLDRVALFVRPDAAHHRHRYTRAARERQAVLERGRFDAPELDPFEQLMADHGAALTRARAEACAALERSLLPAFADMADPRLTLAVRFVPGSSERSAENLEELRSRRRRDQGRRSPTFGPGRDDIELDVDGRSARRHASQGQIRILTLAIKAAEIDCVRQARGTHPIVLLDDVSSELDPTRTGAVYEFLRRAESQLFVTTTRPELFETPGVAGGERVDFRLESGRLLTA